MGLFIAVHSQSADSLVNGWTTCELSVDCSQCDSVRCDWDTCDHTTGTTLVPHCHRFFSTAFCGMNEFHSSPSLPCPLPTLLVTVCTRRRSVGTSARHRCRFHTNLSIMTKMRSSAFARLCSLLVAAVTLLLACSTASAADNDTEYWRPILHFSPHMNWINDPNGLVYDPTTQLYHLFAQYEAQSILPGNMSWGHAVSSDLIQWQELPVAIYADANVQIWSGSSVIDTNTSGLCQEATCIVSVWAGMGYGKQTINLAYASSHSPTAEFTKYSGNPVIDPNLANFRDPSAFWYSTSLRTRLASPASASDDGYWVVVVAHSDVAQLDLYQSNDLIHWTPLSTFSIASIGGTWECPDMWQLQGKWVITVSVSGTPGSYFIGQFDGKTFTPDTDQTGRLIDSGIDYYAGIAYSNTPDGRIISVAWMNAWNYATSIPTSPFRGSYTVPRSYHIHSYDVDGTHYSRLHQLPVAELHGYRSKAYRLSSAVTVRSTDSDTDIIGSQLHYPGGRLYTIVSCFNYSTADATFGFLIRSTDDLSSEWTAVGFNATTTSLTAYIDRTRSGVVDFDASFASINRVPIDWVQLHSVDDSRVCLQLLVDWTSVELFVGRGAVAVTVQIFPRPDVNNTRLAMFVDAGEVVVTELAVYDMKHPKAGVAVGQAAME